MAQSFDSSKTPLWQGDQAAGLRKLFATPPAVVVPVVASAEIDCSGALLERINSAFTALGARTLVVDAADSSPAPAELADVHLPSCIEQLSGSVAYFAARGLPRRHVDTRGSSANWLAEVEAAAPGVDVIVLHAEARDLARMLVGREVHPVLLASLQPDSLTAAYAAMKLLAQRTGLMSFDVMVGHVGRPKRAQRIVERLASCSDAFLGALLRQTAVVDTVDTHFDTSELEVLAAAQLMPVALPAHELQAHRAPQQRMASLY